MTRVTPRKPETPVKANPAHSWYALALTDETARRGCKTAWLTRFLRNRGSLTPAVANTPPILLIRVDLLGV